jgi:hypothetical protein
VTEDALAALIADYRNDPVRFAIEMLGIAPREFQPSILRGYAGHDRLAIAACRNAGKTTAAGMAALHFLTCEPGSAVLVITPVARQTEFFMQTLARIWQGAPLRQLVPGWQLLNDELRTTVKQWRLLATSAESGADWLEGFQAARNVLLILDECKAIPDAIIDSCFQILGGHDVAKVIAISTPSRPTGKFFSFFTDPRWKTLAISAEQIPRLRSHFEEMRREHGADDPFFRAQLCGEFADAQEGDSVLPYELLRRAVERGRLAPIEDEVSPWTKMLSPTPAWTRTLGCDVAGRGTDHTVACYRRGPNIEGLFDLGSGNDEMATCGRIVALSDRLRVSRIIVDAVGLGGPMASRLREVYRDRFRREVEVEDFIASARADDPDHFANKKTELAHRLRERLRAGRITLPDDRQLVAELASYAATIDSRGRLRLVDPAKSPDRADALLASLVEPAVSVRAVRAKGL